MENACGYCKDYSQLCSTSCFIGQMVAEMSQLFGDILGWNLCDVLRKWTFYCCLYFCYLSMQVNARLTNYNF